VYGITVQDHFNDLVIATYGRGFWILDDITPLQQLTPSARDAVRTCSRRALRIGSRASSRRDRRRPST
jgi:hypothetical protein